MGKGTGKLDVINSICDGSLPEYVERRVNVQSKANFCVVCLVCFCLLENRFLRFRAFHARHHKGC